METIGIFEAKTHLPSVCDKVAESGQPITISRRGKPLVVVSPVVPEKPKREGIWTTYQKLKTQKDSDAPDFPDVWEERTSSGDHAPIED
ncbi:MAG: type II toxin-antitoxin system Phd/YefM family antitoxin [Akkermansiaceae bacterium]